MPTPKRSSLRKRRDVQQDPPSSDPAEEQVTPTRPAKRRRMESDDERPETDTAHDPDTETEQTSASVPKVDDDATLTKVIGFLKTQPVQASKDHANSIHEANGDGVKAYAKIAAHDWTYYITKLSVNIGREPEGASHEATTPSKAAAKTNGDTDEDGYDDDQVHIDLGPSKTVSREHAVISFDAHNEKWVISVKGRNGVKVDTKQLKPNETHALSSGEAMEIGGVEMLFVLPSEISPLHIHPSILDRAGLDPGPGFFRTPRRPATYNPSSGPHGNIGTPPSSLPSRTALATTRSPLQSTPGAVIVGANGADLSKEENKHIKPQYSYAQMITQAITSVPESKLTLNGIYTYIVNQYAYYRNQPPSGWQNSIRHNLSLNKHFEKVARSTYEPGKGAKWQIVPESKENLVRTAWRIGRGGHRGSSAPSSPGNLTYLASGPREMASNATPIRNRQSSMLGSPQPKSSLPMSQTPDATSQQPRRANATLTADGSPLPRSKKIASDDPSFSVNPQSPTLASSYYQDDAGGSFVTPAPPRVHPRLAPPSTAQRPSQHMPTSSPAPFWRYADYNSTPLRPAADVEPTGSPTKGAPALPPPQDSSPIRGHRALPSSPAGAVDEERAKTEPAAEDEAQGAGEDTADQEEEEFDLAKGFQSINTYHAEPRNGLAGVSER